MPAPASGPPRQVLLVLGMHRSGTSATAGLLVRLGARMARTPMPANAFNPSGYWEPQPLVRLHNRLLAAAGSAWDDWSRLDPAALAAADPAAELAATYEAEFGDAPLAVLKDPRICRFVPLWRDVLDRLDVAPKAVIPLRHPLEVAGSLQRRDGFAPQDALLLWLRHVLEAEHATRGMKRSFLRYEDLMADWRGCADRLERELDLRWPGPAPDAAEIAGFLDPRQRHVARETGPAAHPWIEAARRALDDLAAGRDADPLPRLDAVRDALDAADALMGPAVRRARAAASADTPPETVARLERALRAGRESETAAAARAAAAAGAERRLRAALAAERRRSAGLAAERAALLGSVSWRITAPLRRLAGRRRRPPAGPE